MIETDGVGRTLLGPAQAEPLLHGSSSKKDECQDL